MQSIPACCAFALSSLAAVSAVRAQSVDLIALVRGDGWYQVDADTMEPFPWDPPYAGEIGMEFSGGSLAGVAYTFGDETIPLEQEDTGYWWSGAYGSAAELEAAWPAGTYVLSGTGGAVGEFSLDITVGPFVPIAPKKVLNWTALQSIDPDQPVTIEWEPLTEAGGSGAILIDVGYWDPETEDSVDLWEAPDERDDGLPGLPPDRTSIVIPAGVFTGSPTGQYEVEIEFLTFEDAGDPAPFDDARMWNATNTFTFVHVQVASENPGDDRYLGRWEIREDGWTNTGNWLGWIHLIHRPWVFSHAVNGYIFVEESSFQSGTGGWVYVTDPQ